MARSTAALSPAAFTTFGALLRYLRRRQRLTQIDLAIATGYSTGQISRLEQNQRLPNASAVQALFVPALALDDEPELLTRLLELAEDARDQRDAAADVLPPPAVGGALPAAPVAAPVAPVLITKLYLPHPRAERVARPRLLARLDGALHAPLTLVAAPAGFGKTTLLADWLGSRGQGPGVRGQEVSPSKGHTEHEASINGWPNGQHEAVTSASDPDPRLLTPGPSPDPSIAWLALDGGDNDVATFLRYLIAALQRISPTVGGTTLALLQGPQPPDPDTLMRVLLNDLATLPRDSLLVLDDYHVITTPAIHAALEVLLDHLPPQLHLVIATRADPPLPLARLRARGQLLELRAADLRFTPDEAATFLTQVMRLPLSVADVAALETRTEGWIAGLQLAALAMRDHRDLAGFIGAFTGSNRFVVDYLAEEVFARQPPHFQTFLLHTSILDRLCGSLCDAVMGAADDTPGDREQRGTALPRTPDRQAAYTQPVLEELERANLFVVPLDDERRWYRYHQLFGEVLRERLLSGATGADVARLHRRASAWYAQQELIDDAIAHALTGGDQPAAAHLIEQRAERRIEHGDLITLKRWIGRLPATLIRSRPRLCLIQALVATIALDLDQIEPLLRAAETLALPEPAGEEQATGPGATWLDAVPATARLVRCTLAMLRRDNAGALALAHEAVDDADQGHPFLHAWALWDVGSLAVTAGDLAAAAAAFAAVRADYASTFPALYLQATLGLGVIAIVQGRLHDATQVYEQALARARREAWEPVAVLAQLHLRLGAVAYEWNQLSLAAQHVERAISVATHFAGAAVLALSYRLLCQVETARSNEPAAVRAQEQYAAIAAHLNPAFLRYLVTEHYAGVLLGPDAYDGEPRTTPAAAGTLPATVLRVLEARRLVRHQQYAAADGLIVHGLAAAEAQGQHGISVQLRALQAVVLVEQGSIEAALAALEPAMARAEAGGYVRTFAELTPLLTRLARRSAAHEPSAYVAQVLASLTTGAVVRAGAALGRFDTDAGQTVAAGGAESLNEREREVLRLFADALSNQEIADRLVVARSTVKWHINNLYSKLGVGTRAAALARAKELSLL